MKKTLMNHVQGIFTGEFSQEFIVYNLFTRTGHPLLKETRYFDYASGKPIGSIGYNGATEKDKRKCEWDMSKPPMSDRELESKLPKEFARQVALILEPERQGA